MKQHNANFDKYIKGHIDGAQSKLVNDRHGMVLSYDPAENTATIALSGQDSDDITDIIKEVPCPTYHGLKLAAPEAGRGCYVVFKGGRESQPMITHFYNHDYKKFDFDQMNRTSSDIPKYLTM
jgi:hypothetical protein